MTAGLWFYGLIFFTGAFLWNWRRRLKNDLELVEVANSHDQKQTIQLRLIIYLLGAIFVSLTFLLVLVAKGLHSLDLLL